MPACIPANWTGTFVRLFRFSRLINWSWPLLYLCVCPQTGQVHSYSLIRFFSLLCFVWPPVWRLTVWPLVFLVSSLSVFLLRVVCWGLYRAACLLRPALVVPLCPLSCGPCVFCLVFVCGVAGFCWPLPSCTEVFTFRWSRSPLRTPLELHAPFSLACAASSLLSLLPSRALSLSCCCWPPPAVFPLVLVRSLAFSARFAAFVCFGVWFVAPLFWPLVVFVGFAFVWCFWSAPPVFLLDLLRLSALMELYFPINKKEAECSF